MESLIQRSLAGGEIAPALYGRADQVKYQTGLKTLRNFMILKHGGVANRAGSQMIDEVKNSASRTYLMKFVFNDDQSYTIEVGDSYFRFYRNRARIVTSGVAAYNGATLYQLADLVTSGGIVYYCLQSSIGNLPPNATYWYALPGTIYEIPTPYLAADLSGLKIVQSGDTITITHASYAPRDLRRTGHTAWTLIAKTFFPSINAPGSLAGTGAVGTTETWAVTAVKADTYEESLISPIVQSATTPTAGTPITLSIGLIAGAQEYNVYRMLNGIFGFIGISVGGPSSFIDVGYPPDVSITPPISRNPFSGAGNAPSVGSYYQQRLILASTLNAPEKLWGSRSGSFNNFTISSPLQADDAVTFTAIGRKVNEIRHLVDLGTLILFTAAGVYSVDGDADGILQGNQPPNLRQIVYTGASAISPVFVGNSVIYTQARGTIPRDLRYEVSANSNIAGYKGRDLSVFAGHLFTNYTIARMEFAEIPNSIVWEVRSDGTLLGLTYLPEHEVWGWHRHDTAGLYEDVCCIPEGDEDATYVIVNRTIGGATKRYIECFARRNFTDIDVDARFMDSFLSYDGRNATITTLSLSTGAGWTVDDDITITASAASFVAGDVGNAFEVFDANGNAAEIVVTAYTDTTHVIGLPRATVRVSLRGVATAVWTKKVDQLAGLSHLEGEEVTVFADGSVIANPNNPSYDIVTVAGATISLARPYGVIHVGLPYLPDFKTLDLDIQGKEIRAAYKDVQAINLLVESTRGIFAGQRFPEEIPDDERQDATDLAEGLDEHVPPALAAYGDSWPLQTGLIELSIQSTWDQSGSFVVRQIDPLPVTILSVIPSGTIGG